MYIVFHEVGCGQQRASYPNATMLSDWSPRVSVTSSNTQLRTDNLLFRHEKCMVWKSYKLDLRLTSGFGNEFHLDPSCWRFSAMYISIWNLEPVFSLQPADVVQLTNPLWRSADTGSQTSRVYHWRSRKTRASLPRFHDDLPQYRSSGSAHDLYVHALLQSTFLKNESIICQRSRVPVPVDVLVLSPQPVASYWNWCVVGFWHGCEVRDSHCIQ